MSAGDSNEDVVLPELLNRLVQEAVAASGFQGVARAELTRELRAHLEDGLAVGLHPADLARRFGDPAETGRAISLARNRRVNERAHRRDRMEGIWRTLRHATHSLAKTPVFTWSVILLIGLGVGSVTTIFTLVDHVLLRPLPYLTQNRLFQIEGKHATQDFIEIQQLDAVELLAAVPDVSNANLTGIERPQRLRRALISPDFFTLFDARPALGRLLESDDFRTGEGVVLSYGTWRRLFGADPDVIGRSIRIDGFATTVLGVLEASFVLPEALVGNTVDIWRPIDPAVWSPPTRDNFFLRIAGRLREGSTLAALSAGADALADRRARDFPDRYVNRDGEVRALPVVRLHEATVGAVRKGLGLMFGAVTLLLFIACANVALLFVARGQARTREMAVRRALGARTASLAGQLLGESMMVAAAGAVLGLLLVGAGLRAALTLSPDVLPRLASVAVDARVLSFAISVAVVTAVLFGLLPALRLARADMAATLQNARGSTGARSANRLRAVLVVAEVSLSLVLVTQAASLLRSFALLHREELGFRTDDVWTLPLTLKSVPGVDWVQRTERIRESLAETSGVLAATYGYSMPLEYTGGARCCWHNHPWFDGVEHASSVVMHPVDADYFDLLEIRVVAGAPWSRNGQYAQPRPALVSEGLADAAFGSAGDAVGREMRLADMDFRIVGVVADNRHFGHDEDHGPAVYLPITAVTAGPATMAVLVERAGPDLAARLSEAIWRVEPDLPVPIVRSLDDWTGVATARRRFESLLFATFGVVALILMACGLCGALLHAIGQRRRELGIRLALGETSARLEARVLSQGLRIAAVGCTLGIAGAWTFGKLLQSRLFGTHANDPTTIVAALGVLLAVAILSSWLPARRAGRTDPMEVLRAE